MVFTDNDRSKVNEDIDVDEVDEDEVDETESDESDQADGGKEKKTPEKTETKPDDKDESGKGDEGKGKKPEDDKGEDYWKTKFSESTRENQLERERREKAEQKLEELSKPKEITDDLMKQKYPEWDTYEDVVKTALKNQIKLEEKVNTLEQSQSEYHNERKWQGQVDSFLSENTETEKYPIKDKEAFKKFCSKPANKGLNLDILAGAFVFEVGGKDEKPAPKKGELFNTGSGQGATGKHTTDKKVLTADDAKILRTTNPKEYERKVRSGELDIKI